MESLKSKGPGQATGNSSFRCSGPKAAWDNDEIMNRPVPERPLVGAHMSIAGGTPEAILLARKVRATALQIFVKNNNRWVGKVLPDEEVEIFRRIWKRSRLLRSLVAHNSYLINMASPNDTLWQKSIEAMVEELERCRRLGVEALIAHPGAHVGSGEAAGLRRIARALDRIHEEAGDSVGIALETTAGQGTNLGYRFEQLRDIFGQCRYRSHLAVCLDTCHVFAAGYDIRGPENYITTMEEFDRTVGCDRLAAIHMNDSKRRLNSRIDRHTHIGEGEIGLTGFQGFMNDERLEDVPKILETPKGKGLRDDRRNMRKLMGLRTVES